MSKIPNIGFWKLCGSGSGEGFTPFPNTAIYAVLATWPDAKTAESSIQDTDVFRRYRARSDENWTVFMATSAVKGAWSGETPFAAPRHGAAPLHPQSGPLAALTRATIKPSILAQFWRRVPDISKAIGKDPNVIFKIGVGEIPWLHQVTFSIWPNADLMANFARTGPHNEAIKAVRSEGWFKEELYARFTLLSDVGTWGGHSPLRDVPPLNQVDIV